ncbi:ABC transporter permease subunit [Streptomyces yerevanensis]|uniref:ABC transporter permease subunit n=1 Tax=Streptomyces yerevanensis TaxID=66378 RepID=UPI00068FA36F|nr:ABC transporter permease subunit [Streptomyces yerevanensis]
MTTADASAAMSFEWTKIRTLRSTLWCLVLYGLTSVAIGILYGHFMGDAYGEMNERDRAAFDPVAAGFSGLRTGVIALVVFGVLTVTSEYSTGTIRSSLTAVPQRGVFYGAKVLTGTLTAFLVSLVVVVVGFLTAQAALGGPSQVSLFDDGVPQAVFGAVLYATLLCTFSMGLASLLRSSALTMGILVPLFFMVSTILTSLPGARTVAQFLPDVAGGLVLSSKEPSDTVLTAWSGMAVLGAWTALAVTAGCLAVRHRDA